MDNDQNGKYLRQLTTIVNEHKFNTTQKVKQNIELSLYITTTYPARSLSESIYIFLHGDSGRFSACGKELEFKGMSYGYRQTCSNDLAVCKCKLEMKRNIMKKAVVTFKEKSGCDHPSQHKESREKKKETNIKRYGVENVSQNKDIQKKKEDTCLQHFGRTSFLGSDAANTALVAFNQATFGVDYRSQSETGKQEIRDANTKSSQHTSDIFRGKKVYDIVRSRTELQLLINEFESPLIIAKQLNISPSWMFACFRNFDFMFSKSSAQETELRKYIESIYNGTIINNSRSLLGNGQEIDIFLPDLNIGFEFNGTFWHSTYHKDKAYHKDKSQQAKVCDIDLIHIHAADWETKTDIVKRRIAHKIGSVTEKIFARKCEVRVITATEGRQICNEHHLFGFAGAAIHLGLYYNDTIVSYMSFCLPRRSTGGYDYELLRFVSTANVIGGAGKLFKYFIRTYTPLSIYSYSDNDWNTGSLYSKIGFTEIEQTAPGYWYVDYFGVRHNRQKFMKHKLVEQGFDPAKTEFEIMSERNFHIYYDAGNTVWEWKAS